MRICSTLKTLKKAAAVGCGLLLLMTSVFAGMPASVAAEEAPAPAQAPAAPAPEPAQPAAQGFSTLKEIWITADSVRVKLDKPAAYNLFKIGSPPRLVLELSDTENAWKRKSVSLRANPVFKLVRAGQFQNEPSKITRVVIELKKPAEFQAAADGNDVVVTAQKSAAEAAPAAGMAAAPTPPEELAQAQPAPAAVPAPQAPEPAAAPAPEEEAQPAASKRATISGMNNVQDTVDPTSLFGKQLVTLDFYDIDLRDLFNILGQKSGVNVVYGPDITGTVSIQLKDVPFKDAVQTILALKNLKVVSLGKNILQVLTTPGYDSYRTQAISSTRVFPINYAKASDVNTQLTSILTTLGGKGKTLVDDRTNSIILTDTPDGIESTSKLIADLDKPTPQVMIEAKIVQISLGKNLDLGITWGIAYTDQSGGQIVTIGSSKNSQTTIENTVPATKAGPGFSGPNTGGRMALTAVNPGGGSDLESGGSGFNPASGLGLAFGFVKDAVRLNAALSALEQKNKSKVLSNPKIATLNNQPATIRSQTSTPYITNTTQFSQGQSVVTPVVNQSLSGITLTVTPTINADGRITMKIVPDVTTSKPTTVGVPETTSQQANTTVIVKDGETLVIGGLISEVETDNKAQVPFLGSIPLLGHLFKKTGTSKQRAELLVFVTPKIIPF